MILEPLLLNIGCGWVLRCAFVVVVTCYADDVRQDAVIAAIINDVDVCVIRL